MKRNDHRLPIMLTVICLWWAALSGCAKEAPEKMIEVIPGKSIAGVEIGMSKERVMSIMGSPRLSMSARELAKEKNSHLS